MMYRNRKTATKARTLSGLFLSLQAFAPPLHHFFRISSAIASSFTDLRLSFFGDKHLNQVNKFGGRYVSPIPVPALKQRNDGWQHKMFDVRHILR